MISRQLAAAAAFGLFTTALTTPAHAEWLEAKSAHFTLVGDVSEPRLRRKVERLERFDAMMRLIVPNAMQANLPVYIVDGTGDVRRLLGDPNGSVGAFFNPSVFGVFAVSPLQTGTGGEITGEAVLFHEYVHHILLSNLDDPMPGWMSEGMAELFMNTSLESDGSVMIGLGNSGRGYSLNRMGRWDAKRLFESGTKPPAQNDIDQLYAKGWLVMHYLLFSGKRPGEFGKFAAGLKRGLPQLQAAQEAFGDLGKFETELEFYRRRPALPAIRIAPDQLKVTSGMSVRKLNAAEAEIMPMRLQSMVGVSARTAAPLALNARPIGARYPENAFVQRAVAEMEFDARNFDLADAAINRALVADPSYVDALCMKGLLIGNRARREGKPELWREARAVILKANKLSPDMALPFILYFDTFEASGGVPNKGTVDGLMRAIVIQPTYQDLRVKVGLHLIATGDPVRARQVLAPVAFSPHTKPDNPLAKLLAEIDQGTRGEALAAKVRELKVKSLNLFDLSTLPKQDDTAGKDDKAKYGFGSPNAGFSPEILDKMLRQLDAEMERLSKESDESVR